MLIHLTSAGVERVEDKRDIVEVNISDANLVDISNENIVAVTDSSSDDKEVVVVMLDAKISVADEELNTVLRNIKRKRSKVNKDNFGFIVVNSNLLSSTVGLPSPQQFPGQGLAS